MARRTLAIFSNASGVLRPRSASRALYLHKAHVHGVSSTRHAMMQSDERLHSMHRPARTMRVAVCSCVKKQILFVCVVCVCSCITPSYRDSPYRDTISFRRCTDTAGNPVHDAPHPAGHRSDPPCADVSTELNHADTQLSHLHTTTDTEATSPCEILKQKGKSVLVFVSCKRYHACLSTPTMHTRWLMMVA